MRRIAILSVSSLALFIVSLAPASAGAAMFPQCPPVDHDTGCQFLITVTNSGVTIAEDPGQGPYDGEDDTMVGIQNSSSNTISSIPLSSAKNIYGFDGDGLCDPPAAPRAPGCVVLAKNGAGEVPVVKPGTPCEVSPMTGTENDAEEPCGHEVPGEPTGLTAFPEGIEAVGFSTNGDAVSAYEGPGVWFSNISGGGTSGEVNFSPALAPGAQAYFALEETLAGSSLTVGNPSSLSTTLSGGGQIGAAITVVQGTPVSDAGTVGGVAGPIATGSVSYAVYSDAACTQLAAQAGSGAVSSGAAGPSVALSGLAPGKYYWAASYSGDINNQASASPCGSEVLTVLAPTTTTTTQSGGGVKSASITVPVGTPVTDTAQIAGSLAPSSTGTVSYVLYKDSKCTVPAAATSASAVLKGAAAPSLPVKPAAGTYYWRATYSGDGANAGSVSACGTEVLVVAKNANLGLGSILGKGKQCVSLRRFIAHPRAPKGVKLVSVEVQINGKRSSIGKLVKGATTINLRGLPKGTFKVALIATSTKGQTYEDVRTFKTCVPKKHHKKKK
jgi:hypothetical protein